MRYVLLSTPGDHEGEHPIDLIVDQDERCYFELWAYTSNKPVVEALNNLTDPRWKYTWTPWESLDVDEDAWAQYHEETFAETTARLFNKFGLMAEANQAQGAIKTK